MLFVTQPQDGERLWIPLDKVCMVEEEAKGYNNRRLEIHVLDVEDPITLENEEEIALFIQAFAKAHNNDVVGHTDNPA